MVVSFDAAQTRDEWQQCGVFVQRIELDAVDVQLDPMIEVNLELFEVSPPFRRSLAGLRL